MSTKISIFHTRACVFLTMMLLSALVTSLDSLAAPLPWVSFHLDLRALTSTKKVPPEFGRSQSGSTGLAGEILQLRRKLCGRSQYNESFWLNRLSSLLSVQTSWRPLSLKRETESSTSRLLLQPLNGLLLSHRHPDGSLGKMQ